LAAPHGLGTLPGQGAPRTCRCIETARMALEQDEVSRQGAPRTCRCIETVDDLVVSSFDIRVREHHAPVGALRPSRRRRGFPSRQRQGAPRTCRCIETSMAAPSSQSQPSCQGAPRTCRCIETEHRQGGMSRPRSGSTTHLQVH